MTSGLFKGCQLFDPVPDADGRRNCANCTSWGGEACNDELIVLELHNLDILRPT